MANDIKFSEKEHAVILIAFYNALTEALGQEEGRALFLEAENAYGERRGRRMAKRVIRDGNPLDLVSFLAYGELISTPGAYKGEYKASKGLVRETQWACPWASAFREFGGMECAKLYCTAIDITVMNGFNRDLDFEYRQNMHTAGTCEFFYRGSEIEEDTMETCTDRLIPGRSLKHDMTYHTADVWQSFCGSVGEKHPEIVSGVKAEVSEKLGSEAFALLEELAKTDFEAI